MLAVGMNNRTRAEAAYRELRDVDHRHVTTILAGMNLDGIAAAGRVDGILQTAKSLAGPHPMGARLTQRPRRQHESQRES
ncbi:MAG: hypothetical protein CFE40_02235 [Burkholderiales bacterium PBB1]|nr:MAG: hypothetical protein CFE40_02235 [Burkholderiales bacterium PBB1]